MTPEQRAARAVVLRQLLEDPEIKDAFSSLEADIFDEWKRTFEASERDNLWRALNQLGRLKQWMISGASHDLTALKRAK